MEFHVEVIAIPHGAKAEVYSTAAGEENDPPIATATGDDYNSAIANAFALLDINAAMHSEV